MQALFFTYKIMLRTKAQEICYKHVQYTRETVTPEPTRYAYASVTYKVNLM